MQRVIALDMEGVLTPEIWIAVAQRTGIDELRRTTRDEPDYDALMRYRIDVLNTHGVSLKQIREVIAELPLLEGAREFLDELRRRWVVVLLSDTFEQFDDHFLELMGYPHLLCHRLDVAEGRLAGWRRRVDDAKRCAVEAYRALNYHVTAIGDSYNDLTMLRAADAASLFRCPEAVAAANPDLPSVSTYREMLRWIDSVQVPATR
ncbi:bifunctional phosphoserine phosphatase/homoserine phosphotransferase ThrH [Candidatus Poriferisodalis multihospitum]|uniref:bifunctional phosphoserine phosphatase/homoserine phosphotransferase ThrH n=1 Tax=Candidatus Poriferisodalis multihospitum TaxID=2983191 RepID=UPI002B260FAC|nr:bifunctional phosphoserine phosphatase/homoserine phosphotransferase ThrH [Candidatus Poriferisodalis multihospitum]